MLKLDRGAIIVDISVRCGDINQVSDIFIDFISSQDDTLTRVNHT